MAGDYFIQTAGLLGRTAWECPRCHKINAPHVDRCDCEPEPELTSTGGEIRWIRMPSQIAPLEIYPWQPTFFC